MKVDELFVKEHLDKWTKAWNDHNLKEILSLYSENILFRSPKVNLVYPDRTSVTITNKTELEEYFSLGLKKYPNLYFVPVDYFFKNHKVIFEYHGVDNKIQWSVIEKFEFNTEGLISNSEAYYGVEEQYKTLL
jgi:hypothetical protein